MGFVDYVGINSQGNRVFGVAASKRSPDPEGSHEKDDVVTVVGGCEFVEGSTCGLGSVIDGITVKGLIGLHGGDINLSFTINVRYRHLSS